MRDQASDEEKCLTFADMLAGSAKNWQYYHARRRYDESLLGYLCRLNVAGLRARLKIKDGSTKDRREHVDHFIETLEDPNLADRLTLLRLSDADDLEEPTEEGCVRIRQAPTKVIQCCIVGSGQTIIAGSTSP
ncbi:hypothetical protein PHMEG_00038974 [Phytophthora megakarya]|uniref:Uncharacterized protein n=1 Tax=Phytophthora megakarya TaxID=4795 RepID=A0A225UGG6_9STRA|nr:hypothetical protein PHMEG_00038974 [Phytophthora megakarya]